MKMIRSLNSPIHRSYFETIDVLYGTNIFTLRSEVLMLHLPELLVPQRLESNTYLELLIKAREVRERQRAVGQDFSNLAVILEHIVVYEGEPDTTPRREHVCF